MSSLGAARAGGAWARASARARARASEASESMPRGRRGARRTRARANGAARALTLAVIGALALARAVDALPQCSVSSASMAAVTARADDGAKATTLEIAGRGGDPYDATTLDATKKRCFDDYVFESASDATRRWVLMSWPATSALTNATSFANATFDVDGSARATLRPDVEGKYSAALVDTNGCYASQTLEVEVSWTCETSTNTAVAAAFIAFAAFCAYSFGRNLESSDFEDKRNVILDVGASYKMIGSGEADAELDDEYKRELDELTQEIKSEHITYVTKIDLDRDLKNILVDKKKSARERAAKEAGLWNEAEEQFQKNLYAKERAERRRSMVGEQLVATASKLMAWVKYTVRLRSATFALMFRYKLAKVLDKEYWSHNLLRFQLYIEFFAFTAFAWRRSSHSNEMYRDAIADVFFYPGLFGPDMTERGAKTELTNWFVVLLFGVVICPVVVKFCGRVRDHFDQCMWAFAEYVELGGDKTLTQYSDDPDAESGGGAQVDEETVQVNKLAKVHAMMSKTMRRVLLQPVAMRDDFTPVRDREKQRFKVVPDVAWENGSDEAILRTVRLETTSPLNLRLIPREAAERMELMAEYALRRRTYSKRVGDFRDRVKAVGFVLRVLILRVALVPMVFASLGFLMVTTSFTPTPWIHVSKDPSASFGDNLMISLFVGLGAIAVSMKMAVVSETLEPNLRPVPIFEMLSIFLKVSLATIAAYMEGELPGHGVPALDSVARLESLNSLRNIMPVVVCLVLLVAHMKIQSLRGFGQKRNESRAGAFGGAFMFAVVTYFSRIFNNPPWMSHGLVPHTGGSNWTRPGVVIGIIMTLIAMVMVRVFNHSSGDHKCIRSELEKLSDPEQVEKVEKIMTPEFIKEQVEAENRRDRVVALVAFYNLLSTEQRTQLLSPLVKKTNMPRASQTKDGENEDVGDAWDTASDAFEELGIIMHCIIDDPDQEFLQVAGEGFIRSVIHAYVQGTVEIALWCDDDSPASTWEAVKSIVSTVKDCIKGGESKTFQATVATVSMECIQSFDFANLMSTLLFKAHDIDLDMYGEDYVVSARMFRQIIDDAFEIPPRPIAKKLTQAITHVRDPDTDEVRRLDKAERVTYVARSWLRQEVKAKNRPELNWFSSLGYYAAVGRLQNEADEERLELAHDFMKTLLDASLSTDKQISFYSIRTLATLVRVGDAGPSVFAVDGLKVLFECMEAHAGSSKETFVSEILYALTNADACRSEFLSALSHLIVSMEPGKEREKIHAIELLHQSIKLEMSAVYRVMNTKSDEGEVSKKSYKAFISMSAAQFVHDALYGMLIDDEAETRELSIHALVDLITLFVWGTEGNFYDFEVPVTGSYTDAAFERFVDAAKRKMPGGALMSKTMYRRLYGDIKVQGLQKDTDKLIAVLLKIVNTDDNAGVRAAAERGISDMRALLSDDSALTAITLYDESSDVRDVRGAAPSRETLHNVSAIIHSSVERQRQKDETISKLRLNEFWRKMKEREHSGNSHRQAKSTRGGRVEIERDSDPSKGPAPPIGGRMTMVKGTTGFKRVPDQATPKIVRHPPPPPPTERLERQRRARSALHADRLAKREAASDRWYGGENFRRQRSIESANNEASEVVVSSNIAALNERPTFTAPRYGTTKVPREFRRAPRPPE